jgi:hypothetical protein
VTTHERALRPELVATDAAADLLARPVFAGYRVQNNRGQYLGGHVAVNAYDLNGVEAEAYARGRFDAEQEAIVAMTDSRTEEAP